MDFEGDNTIKHVRATGLRDWLASTGYHTRTIADLDKIIARREKRKRDPRGRKKIQRIERGVSL